MLECRIKGIQNRYPFRIEASKIETVEQDFDPDFLRHMYPRLEWPAFKQAADSVGASNLPPAVNPEMLEDEDFLKAFHHALLEVVLMKAS